MKLETIIFDAVFDNMFHFRHENVVRDCTTICENFALNFHNWMRENDTQENAERWFGFSDQDMMNEFKKTLLNSK